MSTTWTYAAYVDALAAAIDALPVIDAMDPRPEIRVALPSAAESISDMIVFGIQATDLKEKVLMGQTTQDEEVGLTCLARAIRYGSGDVIAKQARDRVVAYVAIVDDFLRQTGITVGTQTLREIVTNRDFTGLPGGTEGNPAQFASIIFDIEYRARTAS